MRNWPDFVWAVMQTGVVLVCVLLWTWLVIQFL